MRKGRPLEGFVFLLCYCGDEGSEAVLVVLDTQVVSVVSLLDTKSVLVDLSTPLLCCCVLGGQLALVAFQGSAEKIPDIFSAKTAWDLTVLANWFWCAQSLLHLFLQIPNF